MAQIKRGSAVKKALATFFLSASTAYIRAKRIIDGIALQYAVQPRPALALAWAMLTAAFLYPLHRCARAGGWGLALPSGRKVHLLTVLSISCQIPLAEPALPRP
jgi:hypothetical protein